MIRKRWTPTELEHLREAYPVTATPDLAQRFGCTERAIYTQATKLGLQKSPCFLLKQQDESAARLTISGRPFRFRPGNQPWNSGLKGVAAGGFETRFQPGQRPQTWQPIGSVRLSGGYLQQKISDTGYPPKDWRGCHILVWEEQHGPVPSGHVVIFRDGNRRNLALQNLECISRAELSRRNRGHHYPPELKAAIRLRNQLNKLIEKQT